MPAKMQAQAMSAASRALDRFDVLDCRSIASHIKKVTLVARAVPSPAYEARLIWLGGCRSLTRSMAPDGNAWLAPASAATSRTARGASSTSAWSRSGSSSSKGRQHDDKPHG